MRKFLTIWQRLPETRNLNGSLAQYIYEMVASNTQARPHVYFYHGEQPGGVDSEGVRRPPLIVLGVSLFEGDNPMADTYEGVDRQGFPELLPDRDPLYHWMRLHDGVTTRYMRIRVTLPPWAARGVHFQTIEQREQLREQTRGVRRDVREQGDRRRQRIRPPSPDPWRWEQERESVPRWY